MKVFVTVYKTMWKKEKMLVTSIFSFSHNVFKRLHFPSLEAGLCSKGLKAPYDLLEHEIILCRDNCPRAKQIGSFSEMKETEDGKIMQN